MEIAIGALNSDPGALLKATGSIPKIIAIVVIKIGLNLIGPACSIASFLDIPLSLKTLV